MILVIIEVSVAFNQNCQFSKFKITKEEIETNKDNIMMIVKNSMLEEIGNIKGIENGTFIYSMWEGYLEKSTALLQFLERHKLEFIKIHTSGHANNNFIMKFIKHILYFILFDCREFLYPLIPQIFGPNVEELSGLTSISPAPENQILGILSAEVIMLPNASVGAGSPPPIAIMPFTPLLLITPG